MARLAEKWFSLYKRGNGAMTLIHSVALPDGRNYPVFCGGDAATALNSCWSPAWHNVVVLGDSNTATMFGPMVTQALEHQAERIVHVDFPAGEEHKTRETKAAIEDAMLAAGLGRDTCLVAVGGGIALDVGGFVAATYMRGIPHILVATTLLAQVDAAIGGKTAINTRHGKNLVGSFYQPRGVLLYTPALERLPSAEMRNGLVEAIKHAILWDEELLASLEASVAAGEHRPSDATIARCVTIKAEIVTRDERDTGIRQVLNFGHTVGHALEMATHHTLRHGEAVAVGMLVELALDERFDSLRHRLRKLLHAAGLPLSAPCSFADMAKHLLSDKKNQRGTVHCALPSGLGCVADDGGAWTRAIEMSALENAWQRCME